jgi:SOS-response transcriptional repressor LexA
MTKVQHQVLAAIRALTKNGFSPTVREIAAHGGFSGVGTVHKALTDLRAVDIIDWTPGVHRSIEIVTEGPTAATIARLPTAELHRLADNVQAEIRRRLYRGRLAA